MFAGLRRCTAPPVWCRCTYVRCVPGILHKRRQVPSISLVGRRGRRTSSPACCIGISSIWAFCHLKARGSLSTSPLLQRWRRAGCLGYFQKSQPRRPIACSRGRISQWV
jgi:hypothetical protein